LSSQALALLKNMKLQMQALPIWQELAAQCSSSTPLCLL
jgi:hypothetical protein